MLPPDTANWKGWLMRPSKLLITLWNGLPTSSVLQIFQQLPQVRRSPQCGLSMLCALRPAPAEYGGVVLVFGSSTSGADSDPIRTPGKWMPVARSVWVDSFFTIIGETW